MFFLILSLLAGAAGQAASHGHGAHHSPTSADHPSVHGMAVVGSGSIYLSHLPMFHSPHDYQVILEAKFDGASTRSYLESRASFEETVYTIAPESFVLPEMVAHPRPFRAKLYRGHFERGGALLGEAEVRIKRVVYFRRFDPQRPKSAEARFVAFGNGKFLAHEISSKPDFDQILSVDIGGEDGQVFTAVSQENKPVASGWLRLLPFGEREPMLVPVKSLYLEEGDLSF